MMHGGNLKLVVLTVYLNALCIRKSHMKVYKVRHCYVIEALDETWKDVVNASCKLLCRHLAGGTAENRINSR